MNDNLPVGKEASSMASDFGAWSINSSRAASGNSFLTGFGAWSRSSSQEASGSSFLRIWCLVEKFVSQRLWKLVFE